MRNVTIFLLFLIQLTYCEYYIPKQDPDSLHYNFSKGIFSTHLELTEKFSPRYTDFNNAILVDLDSSKILYEHNAYEPAEIASVTKMMTMLLAMEAIDDGRLSLSQELTASARSSKMGGSQIFLKHGEKMSVETLLKCVTIVSANDATYLIAETLGGEDGVGGFVKMMNKRARELGMNRTVFYYPHGLPPSRKDSKGKSIPGNLSTCYDLAILAKELVKYDKVMEWSSTWMDNIRTKPGQKRFGLRNTNRLIKDYKYFDGLKTGYYNKAGFCVVATAKKEGRRLVAVSLGSRRAKGRDKFVNELVTWGYDTLEKLELEKAKLQEDSLKQQVVEKVED